MSWIDLQAGDGHAFKAFCVQPAQPRGAVVVLQEIFGITPHIQALCARYAGQGWLAIAPALFNRAAESQALGYDAEGMARGRELKSLIGESEALLDVQAAIDEAARRLGSGDAGDGAGAGVATIGFCWGGTLSWLAAARLSGLRGAVAYYGTEIAAHVGETPKVPVLLHFGEQDTHIPPEHVDRIARAHADVALHRYPAGHAFNCDDRPAFHAASAALAADRTHQFLKDVLPC